MPLIWDKQLQAFRESGTPLAYNPGLGAWQETEGCVYNSQLGAWEKVWPGELYLYKDGDECTDITGGWKYQPYNYYSSAFTCKMPTIERRADSLYTRLVFGRSFNCALIGTANIIDTSRYTKMCCEVSGTCSSTNAACWGEIAAFAGGYSYNYKKQYGCEICYGGYGGHYASSNHALLELDITDISSAAFAIEHVCDSIAAPDFVQLFKLWLE